MDSYGENLANLNIAVSNGHPDCTQDDLKGLVGRHMGKIEIAKTNDEK